MFHFYRGNKIENKEEANKNAHENVGSHFIVISTSKLTDKRAYYD